MEKFLRYIIIISTTALAVLLFYPFDEISRGQSTPKGFYSSIDGTVASQFITGGDAKLYWEKDIKRRNECERNSALDNCSNLSQMDPVGIFQEACAKKKLEQQQCAIHPFRINFYRVLNDVTTFARGRYEFSEFNNAAEDFYSCIRKNESSLECPAERIAILGEPIYEKYMDSQRKKIGIGTWIVNLCAAALIISLLIGRKSIARSISNALRTSKETIEDAAKKVHDKV